jgi:hypothetical protein
MERWKVLLLIVVAVVVSCFMIHGLISFDHKTFDTIENNGEISIIDDNSTVFLSEGAYVIGNVYAYNSTDDDIDYTGLTENYRINKEILVKTSGKVIVYWDESQYEQALGNK